MNGYYVSKTITESKLNYEKNELKKGITTSKGTLRLTGTIITYTDGNTTLTGTYSEETGEIVMLGKILNSNNSGTDNSDDSDDSFARQLDIGDYISMTPTVSSYTISKSETGYYEDVIIQPSELTIWRVIRKNEDGTVDCVSEYTSSVDFKFVGKEGYINFVGCLQSIAEQYINPQYVTNARCFGYNGQTTIIEDTSKIESETQPWDENSFVADCTNEEDLGGGDELYVTDMNLVQDALGKLSAYKVETSTYQDYWWSSRSYVANYSETLLWAFGCLHSVSIGLYHNCFILNYERDYGKLSIVTESCAFRPIITLKSTLNIASGDGKSEANAYQLTF